MNDMKGESFAVDSASSVWQGAGLGEDSPGHSMAGFRSEHWCVSFFQLFFIMVHVSFVMKRRFVLLKCVLYIFIIFWKCYLTFVWSSFSGRKPRLDLLAWSSISLDIAGPGFGSCAMLEIQFQDRPGRWYGVSRQVTKRLFLLISTITTITTERLIANRGIF